MRIRLSTYSTKPRGGVVHTLALAEALGLPRVQAVLGRDGPEALAQRLISGTRLGEGRNLREETHDPTAHAEVVTIRRGVEALQAHDEDDGWHLDDCTLVVTLEPCTMCAGAITLSRVDAVVFGAWEPKTGAVGSLWDVVRDRRLTHRPQVRGGVLAEQCAAPLEEFFARQR